MERPMSEPHSLDLGDPGTVSPTQSFHTDPFDVVTDPDLTTEQKRALLADWASDARAVLDHPALRRLDNGAIVDIDAVLAALKRLDGIELDPVAQFRAQSWRRSPIARGRRGRHSSWRFWHRDDDDDPPTCPASAVPWKPRPTLDAMATLKVA